MQIATWNVNSLKVRLPQVIEWLKTSNCDILALQEIKQDNENFPLATFNDLGYYCAFNGQKTYNGVAIISKYPIDAIVYDIPGYDDIQKRVISGTICGIRIMCAYVVNGESVGSEKYNYKLTWLKELHNYVATGLARYPHFILLGDFNIAPQDIDVYDPLAFAGSILCSDPERQSWGQLLQLGLYDSFRLFNQEPLQYSWWDYRNFAFKRKLGLRIDHILISNSLKSQVVGCAIDILPRKNERPSDHTPVILTLSDKY
ncbi:MAG: exodeoxyribonuclease III [Burkholderiales bacterium]|nr:exodeoxyribonuclease III [Burkholderiales bacterium]